MNTTTQQREWLEQLIQLAEQEVQNNPRIYNIKVTLLALLGYAVIFGMLFLLISLLGGMGWAALASSTLLILLVKKKIIFAILAMVYVLVRALWVRFESPTGYELKLKDFPDLDKELKLLSRILRSPKIHQLIITPDYNAAIVQTPRLGVFGWYKNTLFLGLELLMSMTLPQARSVIAHEMGHLSGKHSRFSGWIYRIRISWYRIMEALEQQQNIGADLLRRFFDWYSPTFAAYSFALARANEYNADKIAAKLTTNRDTANALVSSYVVHDLLEEHYWQPFLKQAIEMEKPAESPYNQLLAYLKHNSFETTAMAEKVVQAMTTKTGPYDTHPALRDRLMALNCEPIVASEPIIKSAAKLWFGNALADIIKDFDADWMLRNSTKWSERYKHAQKGRAQLTALKEKPLQSLKPDELWQLASLTEEFALDEDCLPLYEYYSKLQPNDANADFVIGRLMLSRNNDNGVDKITQAMGKQPEFKLNAYDWLIHFYYKQNDQHAVKFWQEQAERLVDINKAADNERAKILINDQFIRPDRQIDVHSLFTQRIMNIKGLKRAWLAEKRMRYYPEHKTYVLVFEKGMFDREDKIIDLIASQLDTKLNCFIVPKSGKYAEIAKQAIKAGIELF